VTFGNKVYRLNLKNWNSKYKNYSRNLVDRSFGRCLCNHLLSVVPWSSLLGNLGVLWGEHCWELSSKLNWHYNWRSVSWDWCRDHCGTCNQIFILSESCCLVSVGRPLRREVGSVSCQLLSAVFAHCEVVPPPPCHTCFMYIQYIQGLCQPRLSTADYSPLFVAYATTAV
jgi:hypothetical protein